jgi:hypothetical protein
MGNASSLNLWWFLITVSGKVKGEVVRGSNLKSEAEGVVSGNAGLLIDLFENINEYL